MFKIVVKNIFKGKFNELNNNKKIYYLFVNIENKKIVKNKKIKKNNEENEEDKENKENKEENEENVAFIKNEPGFELIERKYLKGYEMQADTLFVALFTFSKK